jgi:Uma2 family endonuclease
MVSDRHAPIGYDASHWSRRERATVVAERALTLREFLKLPEEKPALEYWEGVVTRKVSPLPDHGSVQAVFVERIYGFSRPRQLGMAFVETRFSVDSRASLVPDVSFYVRERVHLRSSGYESFWEPPDIAIEIRSPSRRIGELTRKCQRHIELGSRIVLLVEPKTRLVRRFAPGEPVSVLRGDDRIDLDVVLPGFELTVGGPFSEVFPEWLRSDPR